MTTTTRTAAVAAAENFHEAHRLIRKLSDKIDAYAQDRGFDHLHWGHVGDLAYIVERLREATGEADQS